MNDWIFRSVFDFVVGEYADIFECGDDGDDCQTARKIMRTTTTTIAAAPAAARVLAVLSLYSLLLVFSMVDGFGTCREMNIDHDFYDYYNVECQSE